MKLEYFLNLLNKYSEIIQENTCKPKLKDR